jgi:ribose-phosphate pyrophosphokinase
MKTLNLTDIDKSDIKYQKISFPDGQQDIVIDITKQGYSNSIKYSTVDFSVEIKSRLNSWLDLELIVCATKALERLKVKEIHLYIPYLLGARSDRQFQDGGTSYIVDVLSPIINSLKFESVTLRDAHSDVSIGLIKNSININNVGLIKWALPQIDNTFEAQSKVALVSPDGGALKKIYETSIGAKLSCDIINSSKHRDILTGKLMGFHVPILPHQINKTLVWVDDICSGGGTFVGEAIKANENGHIGKKYLVVTHYENTANIEYLSKYFTKIFTTNSIVDIEDNDFIKQMNVF